MHFHPSSPSTVKIIANLITLKSTDGNKPPPCPLADKQDDYCDGWKDGWEKTIVKELD